MQSFGFRSWFRGVSLALAAGLLIGCGARSSGETVRPAPAFVEVRVESAALAQGEQGEQGEQCQTEFVEHNLNVSNGLRMRGIRTYESNGSGVAANDLDGDGDLDLVFASIDRESTILWNEGGLDFRAESIDARFARAVNIVDVDGDGLLDLVYTHRGVDSLSYWRSEGGSFTRQALPGVDTIAYSMAWADMNGDGTLDLVTGAYDADLKQRGLSEDEIRERGGVIVYTQQNGQFTPTRLTDRSETLAIALLDLDGDGRRDVWAANDFALPDGIWMQGEEGWKAGQPFRQISYSSMSIDWGDPANDGSLALFTTDMNPGEISTQVLAAWLPVTSKLEEKHGPQDPQIMANTMQVQREGGGLGGLLGGPRWRNEAARRGVDATGWSWSGKFGDLDNDGYLDIYVVNGMIAENLFTHLDNSELVETNRAFRNRGDGTFADADEWGLGSRASGRGMVMADLDGDGDLDIVVNNLRGTAQLFENRTCGGAGLEVDLAWLGSQNSRAIGARVELVTSLGTLTRDVRAGSGYLSGDPARLHFGFPAETQLIELVIHYPDGATARVDALQPQTLLTVTR